MTDGIDADVLDALTGTFERTRAIALRVPNRRGSTEGAHTDRVKRSLESFAKRGIVEKRALRAVEGFGGIVHEYRLPGRADGTADGEAEGAGGPEETGAEGAGAEAGAERRRPEGRARRAEGIAQARSRRTEEAIRAALSERRMGVQELAEAVGLTAPAVRRHLRRMGCSCVAGPGRTLLWGLKGARYDDEDDGGEASG